MFKYTKCHGQQICYSVTQLGVIGDSYKQEISVGMALK